MNEEQGMEKIYEAFREEKCRNLTSKFLQGPAGTHESCCCIKF